MKSKHVSGFCGIGLHEGTSPRNVNGTALKVCVMLGHDGSARCNCQCHKDIDDMYETAGVPRVSQQNPDWVPAKFESRDYVWDRPLTDADTNPQPVTYEAGAAPTDAGITLESPRYADDDRTPSGTRRRGQLEEEVQRVCIAYLRGDMEANEDGDMTTKHIATLIDADDPPSAGAIHSVLLRWKKIGYAVVESKPVQFTLITPDGMRMGLQALKSKDKASRRSRRG